MLSVMVVPYRPAVLTAKVLSTIDYVSKGRLTLGIAVGWCREEFEAIGAAPFDDRGNVTDEWMEACQELWSAEAPKPSQPSVVLVLWLAIVVFGTAGPVVYLVICQMFPPEQTGRVSTAVNTLTLGGAFLVQAAIGWILDLWPRTASDGWDPDGYSWALALTAAFQALAALVMATARRRRPAIST